MVGWINPNLNFTFGGNEINFLDNQQKDVYYIAFGTQYFPPEESFKKMKIFLKNLVLQNKISLLFSLTNQKQFNETKDEFSQFSDTVLVSNWVNQRAVLNHKKLKVKKKKNSF